MIIYIRDACFVFDDMRHRRGWSFRCGANRCSVQGEQASLDRNLLFLKV